MAEFLQVRARWDGFAGAPGYNVFAFARTAAPLQTDMDQSVAALRVFFDAVKGQLRTSTTVTVEPNARILRDSDGQLLGAATATTAPAVVQGTNMAAQALPAGIVVSWLTETIRGRRALRGRSFLVPVAVSAYENDGTLTAAAMSGVGAAATTFLATTSLAVWGRPSPTDPVGVLGDVTGSAIPDKVAILRSRRD